MLIRQVSGGPEPAAADSGAGASSASGPAALQPRTDWLTAALGMSSYSADIYVDRRDRVFLLDINVFGYPSGTMVCSEIQSKSVVGACSVF